MTGPSALEVAAWLDDLLDARKFRENEPENGLIVDAGRPVRRLGAVVNTSFQAIEAALDAGVDMLLVHHASWPYIDLGLQQEKLARLKLLGVSLGQPEVHRHQAHCDHIGVVTGAGGMTSWVEEARSLGCDTYLTGEGGMYTRLYAKEAHVNLVLAGHYRTEAPGIRTLAERTAQHFELEWHFVEDDPIG